MGPLLLCCSQSLIYRQAQVDRHVKCAHCNDEIDSEQELEGSVLVWACGQDFHLSLVFGN